ncbi:MAG: hypothetical protein J6T59_07070 [Bacteroidales bacterium]|nr:hypothetical protein [Bacteroidales bacterium]MBO7647378.1 hypothetical protein [Bacteroidales bacterium]
MSSNFNIFNHIERLFQKIYNWFSYSHEMFDDEVMQFRISKQRQHLKYRASRGLFSMSIKNSDDIFKYILLIMMLIMLFVMILMSRHVGISDRELEQNRYTELVYNHFHHIGDTEAYKSHPYASTQAQYIDLLIYTIGKVIHAKDIFVAKHLISAIFGWLLILYLSILMRLAYNWRAAFFTAFFLFISPRFLGYSISYLTDVTFAFGFVFTISQLYYFCREIPVIRIYRVIKIILGMLIALSTFNAGFVLIHFLFVFALLNFLIYNPIRKFFTLEYLKSLGTLLIILIGITAVIYLTHAIGTHFLVKSLVSPREAFSLLTVNYPVAENQLFAGKIIGPDNFPSRYFVQFLFITIPIVVLIGFIFFFVFIKSAVRTLKPYSIFIFLYAFFFCILKVHDNYMNPDTMWAIYYAIYPLFMLMAAGGVENAMRSINDVYTNTVVIGLIALFSILPIRHIAFNQPLSFIYFNELSGGIHNAYAKYTIQYDSESNKLSAQWLKEHIRANNWSGDPDHVWQVATNGNQACNLFFEHDSTITLEHMPYHATDTTWDYYISFCNDVPATLLRNGLWPPDSAIMIFRLENLPVTAIYMNKHREQQRSLLDSIAQAQCDSLLNVGDNLHDD